MPNHLRSEKKLAVSRDGCDDSLSPPPTNAGRSAGVAHCLPLEHSPLSLDECVCVAIHPSHRRLCRARGRVERGQVTRTLVAPTPN